MAAIIDDLVIGGLILGALYEGGNLWDKFRHEPKRLKLEEQRLRMMLEGQKAQTEGQRRAYDQETRMAQDYLRQMMMARREEMAFAADDRRAGMINQSQDRQMEMLMTLLGAQLNRPRIQPSYEPPPMSLMGLLKG